MGMNNAAANTVRIVNSRALSLLEQLIAAAKGAELPPPAGACPEPATAGAPCCAGNGDTLGAYLAPAATHWKMDPVSGEDFEASRCYFRRCR